MKKFIVLFTAAFLGCNLYSQSKGTFVLSVNGNYAENTSSGGMVTIKTDTEEKALDMGIAAGMFLSNHFEMGLGLDYYWSSEENYSVFSEIRYSLLMIKQLEYLEIKSHALIPNVYGTYHAKLFNKLFFGLNLKVGKGTIKSKTDYAAVINMITSEIGEGEAQGNYSNEYDYFFAGMRPQLNYFVTKHLGLSLSFGQIQYSMLDGKKRIPIGLQAFIPAIGVLDLN